MAIPDVTVLGAGILGLSAAYACARRGARVRVIETHHVGAGSSGGVVGALAPHTPEKWNPKKQVQFDSLIRAEAWWTEIAGATGCDPGYARLGRLQPIADDRALALARDRAQQAETLWQGRAAWHIRPATEFANWAPVTSTGLVTHDTLTARLHPAKACAAMAAALQGLGAEILIGDHAPTGKVIEATGAAGLAELSGHFGVQVGNGVKGQAAVLGYDARTLPQLFVDGLHIVPHTDGTTAVGSTSERDYTDPTGTDALLDAVIARARAAVPVLRDAPVRARWAGLRPRAKSHAPMLGAHPLRPDRVILNGGFKIGFGMAPELAEMAADLILDGRARIPPEFDPAASLPKPTP
ncbi:FAD dependent oxidoreductase [Dinoroseobacter shibae DFL 12 = DSM 16493]|uniref:FAD dependent oxidoreductase n=1 Tax=Dinoroseobacter shibae (strain DSM 16493 / NCIMB 14021 / DFL 12) TaxID=398580 RepID=A8LKQ9_DINSH|nr:FAD dependent oxidoreductase [Dinoroseobacter shibae DFL 12 = DSM 16493]